MNAEMTAVTIAAEPFDPDEATQVFRKAYKGSGAIVAFVGQVRSENDSVEALRLDYYPGFTEAEITNFMGEAMRRWPLDGVQIVHRVGVLSPEAPIVFVVAAAAHRRDAFEAVDFLMDYLKSDAPFWKQEILKSGEKRWIKPHAQDREDRARWKPERSPDARR